MSAGTDQLEAKTAQRTKAKKRMATLAMLQNKKPAARDVDVVLNEGEAPVTFRLVALGPLAYDELLTAHQPKNARQKAEGLRYDSKTFAPALMSRVITEPKASEEDWIELRDADNWGRGEFASLWIACDELCNKGLDPAPLDTD